MRFYCIYIRIKIAKSHITLIPRLLRSWKTTPVPTWCPRFSTVSVYGDELLLSVQSSPLLKSWKLDPQRRRYFCCDVSVCLRQVVVILTRVYVSQLLRLLLLSLTAMIQRNKCSRLFRSQQLLLCRMEMVKILPLHQYSVDIFSYSGPSVILGSDGKQNTT